MGRFFMKLYTSSDIGPLLVVACPHAGELYPGYELVPGYCKPPGTPEAALEPATEPLCADSSYLLWWTGDNKAWRKENNVTKNTKSQL